MTNQIIMYVKFLHPKQINTHGAVAKAAPRSMRRRRYR